MEHDIVHYISAPLISSLHRSVLWNRHSHCFLVGEEKRQQRVSDLDKEAQFSLNVRPNGFPLLLASQRH